MTHFDLNVLVDFETKTLKGYVDLHMQAQMSPLTEVILDSNGQKIEKIVLD